jgi:hypothetical protein
MRNMKISYLRSLGFVLFTCVPLVVIAADQASPTSDSASPASATPSSLSSPAAADVVKLAQSGVTDDVLLAFVNSSQQPYNLSANDILYLKNAGLPARVLEAMLKHDSTLTKSTPQVNNQQNRSPDRGPATLPPSQIISADRPAQAGPPNARPATSSPPAQVQVQGETVANRQPPPARIEPVPPPPTGYDYVWTPGYWSWRDGAWVWARGSWIIRPRPGALWVSGYWMRKDHSWVWVPAHWQ